MDDIIATVLIFALCLICGWIIGYAVGRFVGGKKTK